MFGYLWCVFLECVWCRGGAFEFVRDLCLCLCLKDFGVVFCRVWFVWILWVCVWCLCLAESKRCVCGCLVVSSLGLVCGNFMGLCLEDFGVCVCVYLCRFYGFVFGVCVCVHMWGLG